MDEAESVIKATLTRDGEVVNYSPAAVMMVEDEQYLIMRADPEHLVEEEVLLLHVIRDEDGTRLRVVDDLEPFLHAIEDTLGLSGQIH